MKINLKLLTRIREDFITPFSFFEQLNGQIVVLITISYLDTSLQARTITDYVVVQTMWNEQITSTDFTDEMNAVPEICSFIIQNNKPSTSVEDSQDAILKLFEEECKSLVVTSLQKACEKIRYPKIGTPNLYCHTIS